MPEILISLIICTYNPRQDYLKRVLDALKTQTMPLAGWELVIVDNASKISVASFLDLSWHPGARVVTEEKQGLTHARLCGIQNTRAPLILYIDDDNILPPDYLVHALNIEREFPQMAFGERPLLHLNMRNRPLRSSSPSVRFWP